jgi:hypothetical protein
MNLDLAVGMADNRRRVLECDDVLVAQLAQGLQHLGGALLARKRDDDNFIGIGRGHDDVPPHVRA